MSAVTALRRPAEPTIRDLYTRLVEAHRTVTEACQALADAQEEREQIAETIAQRQRRLTRVYAAGKLFIIDPGQAPALRAVHEVETVKDLESAR